MGRKKRLGGKRVLDDGRKWLVGHGGWDGEAAAEEEASE